MRYIKEIATGHYNPPYKTVEITEQEARKLLGDRFENIEHKTIVQHVGTLIEIEDGIYVGVEFNYFEF